MTAECVAHASDPNWTYKETSLTLWESGNADRTSIGKMTAPYGEESR
jgi:hypothetical protein